MIDLDSQKEEAPLFGYFFSVHDLCLEYRFFYESEKEQIIALSRASEVLKKEPALIKIRRLLRQGRSSRREAERGL